MSKRFTLRKGGSDPQYPWELRDLNCPTHGEHDFSHPDEPECEGMCDAFSRGEVAFYWGNRPKGGYAND
jgi:hypothetical protein